MKEKIRFELKRFLWQEKDDGVGVIEIVLILVVLIALVILFKTQILGLLDKIFEQINSEAMRVY